MKKFLALSVWPAVFLFMGVSEAQVISETNVRRLTELAGQYSSKAAQDRRQAETYLRIKGWEIQGSLPDQRFYAVQSIWQGTPLYYVTSNYNAAHSIATHMIWPGGDSGMALEGSGITIGLWDAGGVLFNHQELEGRVTQKDTTSGFNLHTTHVAGTMISHGLNLSARGMAPKARLDAYDWYNDLAEMALAAASGLLLSNHCYGYLAGWVFNYRGDGKWAWMGTPEVSRTEEFLFGFYDEACRQWDHVSYDAPYYLMVIAAGNDRDDTGPMSGESYWVRINSSWTLDHEYRRPDGNFECIAGPAICKNGLTIGAVEDIVQGYQKPGDVVMSTFSSWGPTDDGRIKPDLVANGVQVYSTSSSGPAQYAVLTGTSMATPSVTGSLALLQQHHFNLTGRFMRAATLKAVVIHTADEAGPGIGPDYGFGWGLMNSAQAAQLISLDQTLAHSIIEETLRQNEPFRLLFQADGKSPIKITLSWTDPAGVPAIKSLDPLTPMLVNDLDLRLVRQSDGLTYFPWKLDPFHPSAGADQADNVTDNIEQAFIQQPEAGLYTLSISHKAVLQNGVQPFSLCCSGVVLPPQPAKLVVKAFLQGAYNTSTKQMQARLGQDKALPMVTPYEVSSAQINALPADAVDWLLLELKKEMNTEPIFRESVLLQPDGMVLDPGTKSTELVIPVAAGNYYIVLRHRNHVPLMSSHPLLISNGLTTVYNSTLTQNAIGENATVALSPGVYGLWAGDLDNDGRVGMSDFEIWFQETVDGKTGYVAADFNLDGQVTTADYGFFYNNFQLGAHSGF